MSDAGTELHRRRFDVVLGAMTYETTRLRLRPLEASDAGPTAALMSAAISRWTATWPEQVSTDEVLARIKDLRERTSQGLVYARAIERSGDMALMGWIAAARAKSQSRAATLGYWIGEVFQGQGYTSEAARAFVPLVWQALDIDVLEAGAQPENGPSICILQRLGMRYVGRREELAPVRNRFEVCAWYALDRPKPQRAS